MNTVTKSNTTTKQASIIALISLFLVALMATAFVVPAKADTQTTTVSSSIGSVISLFSTSGTVNINATPTAGGVQTTASDTVTVSTNNSAGYTLQIAESGAETALTSGGNTIPASTATQASPTALTANRWGYRVDGVGGFGAGPTSSQSSAAIGSVTYAGVPATGSPNTLKTTSATATNDTTTVWYSVAVNTATPTGTYTNSVTYTATTN